MARILTLGQLTWQEFYDGKISVDSKFCVLIFITSVYTHE